MKNQRLEKVKELIARFDIETQDELIERLRAEGFAVTQATVCLVRSNKPMKKRHRNAVPF